MTDAEVLERFNAMLEAQAELAGEVLRCHIESDVNGGTIIHVDDVELDLAAFGRLLQVVARFGMRIAFVDEDDIADGPEIVVREPDDDEPV